MYLLYRRVLLFVLLVFLGEPAIAAANNVATNPHLILPAQQVWLVLISAIVPLVTYVLNHVGPWLTEPIKATVLLIVSAATGAIYTVVSTNQFGWNGTTLEFILTAVITALLSHGLLWRPSGISTLLGAGSNRQHVAAPASTQAPGGTA